MNMDVSVIIVNYNTRDLTLQCLNSVYKKTKHLNFEVIIVDNASSDDSVEVLRKEYPQVCLIGSKENLGFGRANNIGIKQSSGRMLFLLNPDTILINNAIYELYSFLCSHENIAICGGQLYDMDLNKTHSYSLLFPSINWELNIFSRGLISWFLSHRFDENIRRDGYSSVAYITGADMMIRRTIIDKYGAFNPTFFMYFEETELSYRYKKNGMAIAYTPAAKIVHLEGKSFEYMEKRDFFFFTGRKKFYKLTHSVLYFYVSNTIYTLVCTTGLIKSFFLLRSSKVTVWKKRLSMFYNVNKSI